MANPDQIKDIPDEDKYTFIIFGAKYTLYAHSYLGFGGEQAREKVSRSLENKDGIIKDPCLNKGYNRSRDTPRKDVFDGSDQSGVIIEGVSDKTTCTKVIKDEVINAVKQKTCKNKNDGQYTMDCVFQPKWIAESQNFLVFENFYWAASGTNIMKANHGASDLDQKAEFPLVTFPKEFKDASQEVCGKSWDQIDLEYPKDNQGKENNNKWCFILSYTASFLIEGLKLSWVKPVTVQRVVGDSEIEWALGAVYKVISTVLILTLLRIFYCINLILYRIKYTISYTLNFRN